VELDYTEEGASDDEIHTPALQFLRLNADLCVKCPMQAMSGLVDAAGFPVWSYLYSYNPTPGLFYGFAGHASELPIVWGNTENGTAFSESISEAMQSYWTSFAATGSPQPWSDLPIWSQYRPSAGIGVAMNFSKPVAPFLMGSLHHEASRCALWEDSLGGEVNKNDVSAFCNNGQPPTQIGIPENLNL